MVHIFCDQPSYRDTFTFGLCSSPSIKFSFNDPLPLVLPTHQSFKRRRALSDVDGGGNEGRKKRRLRLHLITSRLSLPFSQPATNIVNRGVAKVAVWRPKNNTLGRSELRKAAIMNRVRKRMDAAKDFMRLEQEKGRAPLSFREVVLQKPRIHEMPLPPSPLGTSNYDALELEDEFDDYDEDGSEGSSAIYSDFNIMNPITSDGDEYDYLDAIDGITTQDLPDTPPQPVEEDIAELLREKERQGDDCSVYAGK
ncbi:hypothetical protein GLAREA_00693 [Glarea lozoyensis ATCC 20868]|uniref:Uncharacterized protein n=1 Tax=Glarea lozoyensis (strain ATCC 20868 / MF5171) TaxID=1116229 RepID=S3DSW9_GLAL2|nr:uncharacterized protein GLAREA_00693 [Glarea lozoyensis ATCC 20868]EPE29533.1 hypothetical protein GLAREA_00693 [Glarea lozoyensis ATCC 20868]